MKINNVMYLFHSGCGWRQESTHETDNIATKTWLDDRMGSWSTSVDYQWIIISSMGISR